MQKIINKKLNLLETAEKHGKFTTFLRAVEICELTETLNGEGPFTIFAPNDAAFEKLSEISLSNLFQPSNIERLRSLLKFHIINGKMMKADMGKIESTETLLGQSIKIEGTHGLRVNNVSAQATDLEAANGVIHVINNVLQPNKVAVNNR